MLKTRLKRPENGAENGTFNEELRSSLSKKPREELRAKYPITLGAITAPDLSWLKPNTLHVRIKELELEVLGVRIPAYKTSDVTKRQVWEWLLDAARTLQNKRAIITGDLNTQLGDPPKYCGDCIERLASTWTHAVTECTFRTLSGHERTIDHAFFSPSVSVTSPKKGGSPKNRNLRVRLGDHFDGDAECSTLRYTLGCLLERRLGLRPPE